MLLQAAVDAAAKPYNSCTQALIHTQASTQRHSFHAVRFHEACRVASVRRTCTSSMHCCITTPALPAQQNPFMPSLKPAAVNHAMPCWAASVGWTSLNQPEALNPKAPACNAHKLAHNSSCTCNKCSLADDPVLGRRMYATVPTSCPPNIRKGDRCAVTAHLLYTHMAEAEQTQMKHDAGRNQVPLLSSAHNPHLPINQPKHNRQLQPRHRLSAAFPGVIGSCGQKRRENGRTLHRQQPQNQTVETQSLLPPCVNTICSDTTK